MLAGQPSKGNRYLATNTSHNIPSHAPRSNLYQKYEQQSLIDEKHAVFQYPKKDNENCQHYTKTTPSAVQNRESMQDDSLTSMEWLPEVSIPYMQQARCKITQHPSDHLSKSGLVSRKRNRNNSAAGGKDCMGNHKKPEYSYAMLIYKAISDTEEKRMQLFQIYEWIENHFLYYKHTPGTHWKSSIRHNLSLHKIFVKEAPPASLKSKGSFWALDRRMTEEDWLLCLQPKRPRLARVPNGEPPSYAKRTFCVTPPRHLHHLQHLPQHISRAQHVSRHVSRPQHMSRTQHVFHNVSQLVPRTAPQHVMHVPLTTSVSRVHNRTPQQPLRQHPYNRSTVSPKERKVWEADPGVRSRPNILSKVGRKESRRDSITSPTGTSLMNLNQLFHTSSTSSSPPTTSIHNSSLSPGSSSYESGYSSLTDTCCSQNSPKLDTPRSMVCSTPLHSNKVHDAWSSPPEFSFGRQAAGGVGGNEGGSYQPAPFLMSYEEHEMMSNLSHFMDSGAMVSSASSCARAVKEEEEVYGDENRDPVKSEPREEESGGGRSSLWFMDCDRHPVYYSTSLGDESVGSQVEISTSEVYQGGEVQADTNMHTDQVMTPSTKEEKNHFPSSPRYTILQPKQPAPADTVPEVAPPIQVEGDVIKIEREEEPRPSIVAMATDELNESRGGEEKSDNIAELINQFITEGEVCSTTPLRQYLTEEEGSSLVFDLESPKCARVRETPTRRSLNSEMK